MTESLRRTRLLGLAVGLSLSLPASAAWVSERSVTSPDGALSLLLERDDSTGALAWSVTRGGQAIVTRGALGLDLSGIGVVGDEGTISHVETRAIDTTWTPPYGEHATIRDHFNEETWTLDGPGHGALTVRLQVRVYDEGAALRYLIDGSGALTVTAEKTSFPLPTSAQVWVSTSAQGWISKVAIGSAGSGLERPLTAELAPDLFVALGEAGLRNFARMKFTRSGDSTLVPSLAGDSGFTDSFTTPWRYVRAASSAAALIQGNPFMLNLNEPSEIADTSWIRPGKVLREITLTTDGGMACVDWAAAHGIEYILFDAGWYGPEGNSSSDATTVTVDPARSPGPLDLHAVIAHATSKGVGVILYVNRRALEQQLDEILPLYQSWGVAGIKFGFVNVGSQYWTNWLHNAIAACAEHRLLVDVHDEYRGTGLERTLPNFMTAEGIAGDETSPKNEDALRSVFTRCLAGPADQTNCYFADRIWTMGSHASQLAKTLCIYSPWQVLFWYDRPPDSPGVGGAGGSASVLQDVPEMDFFKRLPTVWDETRWLEGYPGGHATVARRKGATWFLGALNGAEPREFSIPLDFLEENQNYQLELFTDDPTVATTTKVAIDSRVIAPQHVIHRTVAGRNGFAAILTPTSDPLTPPPPPPPATSSLTFKHGADLASSDGLFEVPGYLGVSDTSLVQEFSNYNYGARETLLVGVLGNGRVRDALLRFDLSAIAGEYTSIEAMKLRLHVNAVTSTSTSMVMNVGLQQPGNAGWVEGTTNYQLQTGSACWNHARHNTLPWLGAANGARTAADLQGLVGNTFVSNQTAPQGSWIEIPLRAIAGNPQADTLTKIVNQWISNNGQDNAGLLLVYQSRSGYPQWLFSSSNQADPSLRPELVVEFTPAHPYERWADGHGLQTDRRAPGLDPDDDGLANVFECMFGGDPQLADGQGKQPGVAIAGDLVTFRYRLSAAGAHLAPEVQLSHDLSTWQPLVHGQSGVLVSAGPADPDGTPTIEVSLPRPAEPGCFLRLAVESDSPQIFTSLRSIAPE